MGTFYRVEIETRDTTGQTLKHYKCDNALFSVVNAQYQKALAMAKSSGAPQILATVKRFNNGVSFDVVYYQRCN